MDALFYSTLLLFTISTAQAQDFFPHGLEFETPVALTPSAHNFFNYRTNSDQQQADDHSCVDFVCPPLPQAAEVEAAQELQQADKSGSFTSSATDREVLSSKAIAGIVLGLIGVVSIGGVACYVFATRRANSIRARPVEPPA